MSLKTSSKVWSKYKDLKCLLLTLYSNIYTDMNLDTVVIIYTFFYLIIDLQLFIKIDFVVIKNIITPP